VLSCRASSDRGAISRRRRGTIVCGTCCEANPPGLHGRPKPSTAGPADDPTAAAAALRGADLRLGRHRRARPQRRRRRRAGRHRGGERPGHGGGGGERPRAAAGGAAGAVSLAAPGRSRAAVRTRAAAALPGGEAGRRADAPSPRSRPAGRRLAGDRPRLLRAPHRPRQLTVAGHPRGAAGARRTFGGGGGGAAVDGADRPRRDLRHHRRRHAHRRDWQRVDARGYRRAA
jgi:translation initiation factor IF-2